MMRFVSGDAGRDEAGPPDTVPQRGSELGGPGSGMLLGGAAVPTSRAPLRLRIEEIRWGRTHVHVHGSTGE